VKNSVSLIIFIIFLIYFFLVKESLADSVSRELEKKILSGECGPDEGLLPCKKRIKENQIIAARKEQCQKKLTEIINSCASAGNIYQCVSIRGAEYGITYDSSTAYFFGRDKISYFQCQ